MTATAERWWENDPGDEWWERAACRGMGLAAFFPSPTPLRPKDPLADGARQICARCPVTRQCFGEAVTVDDRDSIRAGLVPAERDQVVKIVRKGGGALGRGPRQHIDRKILQLGLDVSGDTAAPWDRTEATA